MSLTTAKTVLAAINLDDIYFDGQIMVNFWFCVDIKASIYM